jgi:hypothetical protein
MARLASERALNSRKAWEGDAKRGALGACWCWWSSLATGAKQAREGEASRRGGGLDALIGEGAMSECALALRVSWAAAGQ